MFGKQFDDVFHHPAAFIDMGVLSTAKQNRHLNFVVVLKKANRLFDFETNIVFPRFGSHTDFLKFGLMLFAFGLAFGFVVFEFAEIHDPANGRLGIAGHFDQIQSSFLSSVQCLLSRDHTQLVSIFINYTDRCDSDLFIESIRFLVDWLFLVKRVLIWPMQNVVAGVHVTAPHRPPRTKDYEQIAIFVN